ELDRAIGAVAGFGDIDFDTVSKPVLRGVPGSVAVLEPIKVAIAGVVGGRGFDANRAGCADGGAGVVSKEAIVAAAGCIEDLAAGEPPEPDFFSRVVNGFGGVVPFAAVLGAHDAEVMAVFHPFAFDIIDDVAAGVRILTEGLGRISAPIISVIEAEIMAELMTSGAKSCGRGDPVTSRSADIGEAGVRETGGGRDDGIEIVIGSGVSLR